MSVNRATLNLSNRVDSVPATRAILTMLLAVWETAPAVVEDAALLITEVATNAVRHGTGEFVVAVSDEAGTLRVSVYDDSPAHLRMLDAAEETKADAACG